MLKENISSSELGFLILARFLIANALLNLNYSHEEKFHNTPETQGENAYVHPEGARSLFYCAWLVRALTLLIALDIEHFMAHEDIERTEAERVLEFQGLASDGQPVDPNVNQAAFQAKSSDSASDIAAREAREAYALAQALKFGNDVREASKRGGYGETGFFRPKDTADRLRRGVPFKYRYVRLHLFILKLDLWS